MHELKRRANGKGCATYLGNDRQKPWGAKISVGKDKDGKYIYYFIDFFKTELETLVCLENYHNEPYPLYIKEDKYNRIVTFPKSPYPLVPVANPKKNLIEKTKKDNYTYKQLYEDFKEAKMLTAEEAKIEKKHHIRPENKPFSRSYCNGMRTAFNNSAALHDKVWKNLRVSDFIKHLKDCGKKKDSQKQMVNLWTHLDKYAMEEDIIDKGYSQFIPPIGSSKKEIIKSKKESVKKEKLFTYEQIEYLWNFVPKSDGLQKQRKQKREEFVRDLWLMLLHNGMRADELLSVYTENVFLDDNYFIGGLKTEAGINRETPIHPIVKHLYEKYYDSNNEFLFTQPNGNRIDYDYYLYHYKHNFKNLHPEISEHTAHDARHMLRNELRIIGVKDIIINSIIGHSNDDVGEDTYSHVSIEEKLEAIKMVTYKKPDNLIVLKTRKTS